MDSFQRKERAYLYWTRGWLTLQAKVRPPMRDVCALVAENRPFGRYIRRQLPQNEKEGSGSGIIVGPLIIGEAT